MEARDLELINKAADELHAEVEDVLRYQASIVGDLGSRMLFRLDGTAGHPDFPPKSC